MFYLIRLSVLLAITIPAAVVTIAVGCFDRHGKTVYRINQFWTWLILHMGKVRLRVTGLDKLDETHSYIFMVNHQSNIDIPVLVQGLVQFQLRWIAKKELLRVPFFGWAMWASKHVTVDRNDPLDAVKSLKRAQERLAAGISIVVFPEGTRSKDGKLLRFKKGGCLLAAQAGTSIVPLTIIGSGKVLPIGAWRLQPGTIDVIVGEPISVAGFRPGNLRILTEQIRTVIEGNLVQGQTLPAQHFSGGKHSIAPQQLMEKTNG